MDFNFQKDLYLASEQIFPQIKRSKFIPIKLQNRLLKKFRSNAIPFNFLIPQDLPSSVTLQSNPDEIGEPCGVNYYVKVYCSETEIDVTHKCNTVLIGIRKIQYTPIKQDHHPCTIVRKDFLLSPGELELEMTLDKQLYHHGETIAINICIRNNSNKVVKKIKALMQQDIDIVIFQNGQFRTIINAVETSDGCPINPGSNLQKIFYLKSNLVRNKNRHGIALVGMIKQEELELASSTLFTSTHVHDSFGIIVSYNIKVKLYLGALDGELSAEFPFILMKRKPFDRIKFVSTNSVMVKDIPYKKAE